MIIIFFCIVVAIILILSDFNYINNTRLLVLLYLFVDFHFLLLTLSALLMSTVQFDVPNF